MTTKIDARNKKKHEYWNHWVEYVFVSQRQGKPHKITGARLQKIKMTIWNDSDFWFDIIDRHDCFYVSPEQLALQDIKTYDHMIGNFSGMVYQQLLNTI